MFYFAKHKSKKFFLGSSVNTCFLSFPLPSLPFPFPPPPCRQSPDRAAPWDDSTLNVACLWALSCLGPPGLTQQRHQALPGPRPHCWALCPSPGTCTGSPQVVVEPVVLSPEPPGPRHHGEAKPTPSPLQGLRPLPLTRPRRSWGDPAMRTRLCMVVIWILALEASYFILSVAEGKLKEGSGWKHGKKH